MNKKQAINILNKQINKLSSLSKSENQLWQNQTTSYIVQFFNRNSSEYSYISNFRFIDISAYSSGNDSHKNQDQLKNELITFLNNCIETIKDIGLYKPPKANFLSTIPDWMLAIIIPALFLSGLTIGKYLSDVQNIDLKRENIELNKLIPTISSDSITNQTKDSTDYPKN